MSSRPPDVRTANVRRLAGSAAVVVPALALGFFTWLSFFVLGYRARRRDWMLIGAAYSVFSALAFFALSRREVDADGTASTLLGLAILVAWLGGAIHVLVINAAFLRAPPPVPVAAVAWAPPARAPYQPLPLPPPVGADVGYGLGNPTGDYLAAGPPETGLPPVGPLVEANTATQRVLATLPGVTPALARRWVAERRRRGGFRDLDDLGTALGLQPHEIVHLRPRLSFAAPVGASRRPRLPGRGRVLDV